jgi:hypothetical protein
MTLLYVVVFLLGFMYADLNTLIVAKVGQSNGYAIDLVFAAAGVIGVMGLLGRRLHALTRPGRLYLVLLAVFLLGTVRGMSRFGGSAIGETRYVGAMFWFLMPLGLARLRRTAASVEGATIPYQALWISAAAGVVMLLIELQHGGRVFFTEANVVRLDAFTDFRGVRYLDSYQTFNLMLAGVALLLLQLRRSRPQPLEFFIALALVVAALLTKNRAAVIAVILGMLGLAVLERRTRLLLRLAIGGLVTAGLLVFFVPKVADQVGDAFQAVLHPTLDSSGSWRLALQGAAILKGLRTPWLGEGYGGYYYFDVPGLPEPILAPPHNQFIELFMKVGTLGLLVCLVLLVAYGRAFWRVRRSPHLTDTERSFIRLLLLLLLAVVPYGFAYDFPPLFGFLLGCGEVILQRSRMRADWDATQYSSIN